MPEVNYRGRMARQSPWINERAQLLVRLLDEQYDMQIDEATARDDISDHVDHVAKAMRIGRQAAKYYVTEDIIEAMAERIARAVNKHRVKSAVEGPPKSTHLRVVRPWETE